MELQKAENLCLKNTEINFAEFSMYAFTNSDECSEYYLLRNEGTRVKPSEINLSYQISIPTKEPLKEWLILEEKQCDYFLLLKSESSNTEKILSKLLEIPAVITAYSIDPTKLKSKQNLLF